MRNQLLDVLLGLLADHPVPFREQFGPVRVAQGHVGAALPDQDLALPKHHDVLAAVVAVLADLGHRDRQAVPVALDADDDHLVAVFQVVNLGVHLDLAADVAADDLSDGCTVEPLAVEFAGGHARGPSIVDTDQDVAPPGRFDIVATSFTRFRLSLAWARSRTPL
jgi:hypothetical protein